MKMLPFPYLMAFLCLPATVFADDKPFRKSLTNSAKSVRVASWRGRSAEITPGCKTKWTITKTTLKGGKQDGVDVIHLDNGRLKMTIVPTRGMGILDVKSGDVRLGWDSPVKEVVHPKYINLQARGGLGWLNGFNEFLVRCGLESNGHPGPDEFINNVGDKATMNLTLHGKIANIPASVVDVVVDRKPPYRIRIRGRVDEKLFFGPNLELQTEISTVPGSNAFRVTDVITNRGAQPQEFQILYHANYGRPLLGAGTTFVGAVKRVTPFNDKAAKAIRGYETYAGPKKGFVENVYCLRLNGDKQNNTTILLQNKNKDRGVSMTWSLKQLPYLTIWKNTAALNDGYVTGLEPGTNFPYNRGVERKHGRVPKLAGGKSYKAEIEFAIHGTAREVSETAAAIRALQGNRKTTVDASPMKTE